MIVAEVLREYCLDVAPGQVRLVGTDWMVGVYFLLVGDEVVYVGQSEDVQRRVNQHASDNRRYLSDRATRHHAKPFDRAMWMKLPLEHLDAFESVLIRRLRPIHNSNAPRVSAADDARILAALGLEAA